MCRHPFLYALFLLFSIASCQFEIGPFVETPILNIPIFTRTSGHISIVSVAKYQYYDVTNGKFYIVGGDEVLRYIDTLKVKDIMDYYPYVDKLSSRPTFAWVAPNSGNGLLAVAVFKNRIKISSKGISNIEDCVWLWHSGFGVPRDYITDGVLGLPTVKYSDGKSVISGVIQEAPSVAPLKTGNVYTWAVWYWSPYGVVTSSSREQIFLVE